MKQYCVAVANKICDSLEENAQALLDKLCEGEPAEIRSMAWNMFITKLAFANGQSDWFVLPPLDEC